MGGKGIHQSATRIEAVQVQSSTYGAVIPLVFGLTRVPANLLWYGGFTATEHTEEQGGKGGGGVTSTSYTYSADLMLALAHGTISAVPQVWVGKKLYVDDVSAGTALAQLGFSLQGGAIGQSAWSGLSSYGAQNIAYSGLASVAAQQYGLGSNAGLDNHLFEVQAAHAYHLGSTVPDCDPALVLADVLATSWAGARFPSSMLGTWTDWSNWCTASGLLVSPALTTQARAADVLDTAARLTNTGIVWSGGKLQMVPYADATVTGNGATFTPNLTPVYDLTDEHWQAAPVLEVKSPADRKNAVTVEYLDRAHQYAPTPLTVEDLTDVATTGRRPADKVDAHWLCTADAANHVAQQLLQRSLYITDTWTCTLPWNFALLEPADLVTITDSVLQLTRQGARVLSIQEGADGLLEMTFEALPAGTMSPPTFAAQAPGGWAHDWNVAPGPASVPTIFEAPGALTQNGLELYVAATGAGANWGGCHVWVSLDGSNYKRLATVAGGSRYGTVSSSAGSSGAVNVAINKGQLLSGSAADMAAYNTLCFLRNGSTEEFFSYRDATLTSALHYNLSPTTRGLYGTAAAAFASGSAFVRVDDRLGRSGPIDLVYVGKTVHIKLQSFNQYGGGLEDLSGVTDYTYTITGARVYGNAGAAALAGITAAASDNVLTAGEKPPIILDYTVVTAEQAGLDAQATNYGVTTEKTAYDTALSALTTHLGTLTSPVAWNNLTGDTTIVGTTFRSKWADVFTTRTALQNAIDAAAKARLGALATRNDVDTAQIVVGAVTDTASATGASVDAFTNPVADTVVASVTYTATVNCTVTVIAAGIIQQVCALAQWSTYADISDTTSISHGGDTERCRNLNASDPFAIGTLAMSKVYSMAAGASKTFRLIVNSGGFPRTGPQAGCATNIGTPSLILEVRKA